MRRRFSPVVAILAVAALAGCANGYTEFYHGMSMVNPTALEAVTTEPRIVAGSGDPNRDVSNMFEEGYAAIGSASFTGRAEPASDAMAQAKKVGAAIVVVSRKYLNTASGVMPFTTPNTTTSYSSGTVNAYGSGGYAYGNYSGMTTTYGTQTTYIPYSIDRYAQWAIFFAPIKRTGIGILSNNLTDEQRRAAGTNFGISVDAVRKGSPAFLSDILPGDIILSINGDKVFDRQSSEKAMASMIGHTSEVVLNRGGQILTKTVTVPLTW